MSYHESHCANYKLFNLKLNDNPYSIKIEDMDEVDEFGMEESKSF